MIYTLKSRKNPLIWDAAWRNHWNLLQAPQWLPHRLWRRLPQRPNRSIRLARASWCWRLRAGSLWRRFPA
jgi:hypothetical protein